MAWHNGHIFTLKVSKEALRYLSKRLCRKPALPFQSLVLESLLYKDSSEKYFRLEHTVIPQYQVRCWFSLIMIQSRLDMHRFRVGRVLELCLWHRLLDVCATKMCALAFAIWFGSENRKLNLISGCFICIFFMLALDSFDSWDHFENHQVVKNLTWNSFWNIVFKKAFIRDALSTAKFEKSGRKSNFLACTVHLKNVNLGWKNLTY